MKMLMLPESEYDEWDRFVEKSSNGTIFHTAWWHRAWGANVAIYARKGENGEIEAGVPLYIAKHPAFLKFFGVKGISRPPLTPLNGPVFSAPAKTKRCSRNTENKKELFGAIESLPEVDSYDFCLWRHHHDVTPFIWNGFDTIVHYTYVIPVADALDWRKNMSEHTRRRLRSAQKEALESGCSIDVNQPLEELLPLFFETSDIKGFSKKGYEERIPKWWETVKDMDAGKSYLMRDAEGKRLCAVLMVWDSRTAYVLLDGMMREIRQKSHLNMLLFERMITDAHEMGLDFDFEGSILPGVESFFRGWGGELHTCIRVLKIPSISAYIGWKGHRYLKFHMKRGWVTFS